MKYNKTEFIFIFSLFVLALISSYELRVGAQEADLMLRAPTQSSEEKEKIEENFPSIPDFKNIPNFSEDLKTKGLISLDGRLRVTVESYVNAKSSMVGDYFKVRVSEDFYIPSDPPQLIVPKGSWLKGRISLIKKPNILMMTAKIGLHFDSLVTPLGDIVPLNSELDVEQGIVNEQGFLDPILNHKSKASNSRAAYYNQGNLITVSMIDILLISNLANGYLTALFSQGDNITLNKGQELQIVLKKDIELKIN